MVVGGFLFFNNSCFFFCLPFSFCFFSLILYFWKSNLYSRFLIFALWFLLSILYIYKPKLHYPVLPESEITGLTISPPLDSPFSPPGGLCLFSPPSLLYPTLWISVWSRRWRTPKELVTGRICLSPSHSSLLSFWPPLSTSSLSSSLYNSVNTSERSRLWNAHKEVTTG